MTTHEEHLIELFKKAEKESILGTEYFKALCEFSKECYNTVNLLGDGVLVKDIHSFIAAAYRVGFERGYKAGREYQQDLQKLDAKD